MILCNLALYHAVLHEKESALSLLRRALAFDPDNPDFLFKAPEIHNQFGSKDVALTSLEHAIARGYSVFFCKRSSYVQRSEIRSTFSQAGRT